MSKTYLCKWGNWDKKAVNSYEPETSVALEDFFTDDSGYGPDEIEAIAALEVGEQYNVIYGNHTVSRIR